MSRYSLIPRTPWQKESKEKTSSSRIQSAPARPDLAPLALGFGQDVLRHSHNFPSSRTNLERMARVTSTRRRHELHIQMRNSARRQDVYTVDNRPTWIKPSSSNTPEAALRNAKKT